MLKKIISGGQDGVDIAALRAAKAAGLQTGGHMPFGYRAESGNHPEYIEMYCMAATYEVGYTKRTGLNVKNSDATMIITRGMTPGTKAAMNYCNRFEKDCVRSPLKLATPDYPYIEAVAEWLNQYETVNIAGNRGAPEQQIEAYLVEVFRSVKRLQEGLCE